MILFRSAERREPNCTLDLWIFDFPVSPLLPQEKMSLPKPPHPDGGKPANNATHLSSLQTNKSMRKKSMSLLRWRILGVILILIGLAGVGFAIQDYVEKGRIGGASDRATKNSGPLILCVFIYFGIRCMWVGKPELNLQFPDDTAFKPKFPARRGDKIRVSGDLEADCLYWNTLTLVNCELTPDAEGAIPAEQLTRECMEDDQRATEKYLSGRERYRVVVEGTISSIAEKAFVVTMPGHRILKQSKSASV